MLELNQGSDDTELLAPFHLTCSICVYLSQSILSHRFVTATHFCARCAKFTKVLGLDKDIFGESQEKKS